MDKALLFSSLLAMWSSGAFAANLIVDNVWGQSPAIAYEFPEAEGRADAIRYVEAMRDQFKPGGKVIDAAANRTLTKQQLKNGFILYTTLTEKSELLRLASRRLGWELTPSSFHWQGVTAPPGQVHLILVARNPFAKGYCVIFAAGSNRLLTGINALPHGGASFDVFTHGELVQEGFYDEHFVSTERLSQAAALQDAEQFFSTIRRVHPDLLRKATAEDYRRLRQETAAAIAHSADANGQVENEELARLLYRAAAYFKDGHTTVDWRTPVMDWNARARRFPAFSLFFDNGRFLIGAAKDKTLVGAELVAINQLSATAFLEPILSLQSGETSPFRAARFVWDEPFWYYLTNVFGTAATCTVRVRDKGGVSRDAPLETLSFPEYTAFRKEGVAPKFEPNDDGTKVEFFDSGATAHFLYPSFDGSSAEKKKIDAAFAEIKSRGSRDLILDIRHNGGGVSTMADQIFAYLFDGKFRVLRKLRVRASWDVVRDAPWWSQPFVAILRGRLVSLSNAEHAARRPDAFFSGHVYLLTDNGTFSMGSIFAAMLRDYKVGTIIGYESGGLPQTFGGPHRFTLKNSRIPCTVAWNEVFPAKPWPGDDEHGVLPDVPLSAEKLAGFSNEPDPMLAFTLRYIRTRNPEHAVSAH